jgi:hypothetical protein
VTRIYVTSVSLDLNVGVLGATIDLRGQVQSTGDFDLTGSGTLGVPGLSASASFDLHYYAATGSFAFTAAATAQYNDNVVRASLALQFSMMVDPYGHLVYSGSGTASADINTGLFGWLHVGTVGVGINNNEIWFTVDKITVNIALP